MIPKVGRANGTIESGGRTGGMDAGVEDLTSTEFFCGTGGEIRIREQFPCIW